MGQHQTERLQVIERLLPIERQRALQQLIDQHIQVHLIGHLHLDRWDRILLQVQVVLAQVVQVQVEAEEVADDTNFETHYLTKKRGHFI